MCIFLQGEHTWGYTKLLDFCYNVFNRKYFLRGEPAIKIPTIVFSLRMETIDYFENRFSCKKSKENRIGIKKSAKLSPQIEREALLFWDDFGKKKSFN